jgi:hypothetical protein
VLAYARIGSHSGMAGAQFTDLLKKGLLEYPLQLNGKTWQPPNVLISINIKLT